MKILEAFAATLDGHYIMFAAYKWLGRARKEVIEAVTEELNTLEAEMNETALYIDGFPTLEALEARVKLFFLQRRLERMRRRYEWFYDSAAAESRMVIVW